MLFKDAEIALRTKSAVNGFQSDRWHLSVLPTLLRS
jgi:hypothetical protein